MQSQPYMRRAPAGQAAAAAGNGPADLSPDGRSCDAYLTRRVASTIFRAQTGLAGSAHFRPIAFKMRAFKDCKA
jgi:hypothetical protein